MYCSRYRCLICFKVSKWGRSEYSIFTTEFCLHLRARGLHEIRFTRLISSHLISLQYIALPALTNTKCNTQHSTRTSILRQTSRETLYTPRVHGENFIGKTPSMTSDDEIRNLPPHICHDWSSANDSHYSSGYLGVTKTCIAEVSSMAGS